MPVGGFGGPRKIMKHLSPEGGVYQAGTLSGNPVAMTAGLTTLRVLQREDGWKRLEALGAYLEQDADGRARGSAASTRSSCAWARCSGSPGTRDEAPRSAEALDANARQGLCAASSTRCSTRASRSRRRRSRSRSCRSRTRAATSIGWPKACASALAHAGGEPSQAARARPMTVKRDPTKALQIGFLALLSDLASA